MLQLIIDAIQTFTRIYNVFWHRSRAIAFGGRLRKKPVTSSAKHLFSNVAQVLEQGWLQTLFNFPIIGLRVLVMQDQRLFGWVLSFFEAAFMDLEGVLVFEHDIRDVAYVSSIDLTVEDLLLRNYRVRQSHVDFSGLVGIEGCCLDYNKHFMSLYAFDIQILTAAALGRTISTIV